MQREGRGQQEQRPLGFQGSQGKVELCVIFPGCEEASQLACTRLGQGKGLKWCQSLSVEVTAESPRVGTER